MQSRPMISNLGGIGGMVGWDNGGRDAIDRVPVGGWGYRDAMNRVSTGKGENLSLLAGGLTGAVAAIERNNGDHNGDRAQDVHHIEWRSGKEPRICA